MVNFCIGFNCAYFRLIVLAQPLGRNFRNGGISRARAKLLEAIGQSADQLGIERANRSFELLDGVGEELTKLWNFFRILFGFANLDADVPDRGFPRTPPLAHLLQILPVDEIGPHVGFVQAHLDGVATKEVEFAFHAAAKLVQAVRHGDADVHVRELAVFFEKQKPETAAQFEPFENESGGSVTEVPGPQVFDEVQIEFPDAIEIAGTGGQDHPEGVPLIVGDDDLTVVHVELALQRRSDDTGNGVSPGVAKL